MVRNAGVCTAGEGCSSNSTKRRTQPVSSTAWMRSLAPSEMYDSAQHASVHTSVSSEYSSRATTGRQSRTRCRSGDGLPLPAHTHTHTAAEERRGEHCRVVIDKTCGGDYRTRFDRAQVALRSMERRAEPSDSSTSSGASMPVCTHNVTASSGGDS